MPRQLLKKHQRPELQRVELERILDRGHLSRLAGNGSVALSPCGCRTSSPRYWAPRAAWRLPQHLIGQAAVLCHLVIGLRRDSEPQGATDRVHRHLDATAPQLV